MSRSPTPIWALVACLGLCEVMFGRTCRIVEAFAWVRESLRAIFGFLFNILRRSMHFKKVFVAVLLLS